MSAELTAFLHELVEATCGEGTKQRLHAVLDAIGTAAAFPVAPEMTPPAA